MMYLSNVGQIRLTRGDNLTLPLTLCEGDSMQYYKYPILENDNIYFALMEPNQPWEEAILKKKYTGSEINEDGDLIIALEPKDTMCLLPGLYYYQIKIQMWDQKNKRYVVNTLNPKTQFWIEE